jgi:ATP-dependent DNA helicase RecG
MLEKKLESIIRTVLEQKCENSHLEIKKAGAGCPRLFDTLSSF